MKSTDLDRLREFTSHIVLFPSYHHAYAMLQKSVETTRQRGIPTSALIIGPSGSGKSTLCELFRDSFGGPYESIDPNGVATIRPAFYCRVPSPVTVKSFAKTVLRELGCRDTRGDTVELTYRVMELLNTCRVQVCEFDEFQCLVHPEAEKAQNIVIDWLITLINYTKKPIILAGMPDCKILLKQRAALARRYPFVIELDYLRYSEEGTSDYMILLGQLDEHLHSVFDFKNGVHLTDTDIAVRLFAASSGSLEYIRMILHSALQNALAQENPGLERSDFAQACALLDLRLSFFDNPFYETLTSCYKQIYGGKE